MSKFEKKSKQSKKTTSFDETLELLVKNSRKKISVEDVVKIAKLNSVNSRNLKDKNKLEKEKKKAKSKDFSDENKTKLDDNLDEKLDSDLGSKTKSSSKVAKKKNDVLLTIYQKAAIEQELYNRAVQAYQVAMDNYFQREAKKNYKSAYGALGDFQSDKDEYFDVRKDEDENMADYVRDLFKDNIFKNNISVLTDVESNKKYETWKNLSALNMALSFIYHNHPGMVFNM